MELTPKTVSILPVRITVTPGGVVTVEQKYTDKQYAHVVGFAINYSTPENLAGSTINIFLNGKALFLKPVDTALFTFNSSCPVNQRYYNFIHEAVNNASIGIEYTPGGAFPVGNTVITVSLQCTND